MKTTKVSDNCIKLLHHFEGCKLKAYKCPAGVWTIGFGNTFYEDGSKVKEGDVITQERALSLCKAILVKFEQDVLRLVNRDLEQHEFDALVSFRYNAGASYKSNGQWKLFNIWSKAQRKDADMQSYWENLAVTGGGVKLNGLVKRRKAEAKLYCKGILDLS